jgi:hypothetical protein
VKTVLAVIAAVGLIAGALYVRTALIEGDDPAPTPAAGPSGGPVVDLEDLVVACDATLREACPAGSDRLDLAGLLAAFQAEPVAHDVLVAPTAVVDLIEQSRTSRAVLADDRVVVATTPLVLATAVALDEVVADACPTVTWACAADLVVAGSLVPAVTDPTRTTVGLTAFAALTGGFLDTSTYSTNVLSGSGFFTWLDAVGEQVPTASDPLSDLILFNGARNTAAVVTEAQAVDAVARAATNVPDLAWPSPLAVLQVAAVGVGGADPGAVAEVGRVVGDELVDAGWRAADGAVVSDGTPPLDPAAPGLPSGGVLFSLRELWP